MKVDIERHLEHLINPYREDTGYGVCLYCRTRDADPDGYCADCYRWVIA